MGIAFFLDIEGIVVCNNDSGNDSSASSKFLICFRNTDRGRQ